MSETQTILCINSGSSSLKFHLYEMGPPGKGPSEQLLARGAVEGIGQGKGRIWFIDNAGSSLVDRLVDEVQYESAVEQALATL